MKQKFFTLLAVVLFLGINNLSAQTIKKGPYMIYPNDNAKMTILWQLSGGTACTLSWGTTMTYGTDQAVSEYGTDHQYKYTITGLTPATKYYYKVNWGSTNLTGSFTTAPASTATAVKFLAYGDTRTYYLDTDDVTAQMLSEITSDADYQTFSLHTGDWVNKGQNASVDEWGNQFFNRGGTNNIDFQSKVPLMGVRGNHENYTQNYNPYENATNFYKYFPYTFASGSTNGDNMYYSFDYGPVHISVIDQYDGNPSDNSISSTQKTWLANDLASTDKPWKFILLHEPGWSAASTSKEHGNNYDVQNNIQPLCIQYGVQAVFGGHNHYYAHALVNGVHHFTLGGGGAPLYDPSYTSGGVIVKAEKTFHFLKVEVNGNTATLRIVRPNGSLVETINLEIPVLDPTAFTATGVSTSQIDLSWNQNTDNDDILLAYNTTNTFGTPTGTYTVGNTIAGGGEVLAIGDIEAYNHIGLSGQTYYYKVWSNNGTDYSDGVTTNATPFLGEPTNHVTNFAAPSSSASTVTLTWTDVSTGVIPAGYLVKAVQSGGTITAPTDGIPENNGTFAQNVAQGTQTVTFSNLNSLTTYDFEIYPYTNSGAQIDYKTGGTIPTVSKATTDVSLTPVCEDFEMGSGNSYTTGTYTLETGEWLLKDAGNFGLEPGHTGKCIAINDDKAGAYITTPSQNTVAEVSFYYWDRSGSAGDEFVLQKSVDGGAYSDLITFTYGGTSAWTQFTFVVSEASSDVKIRVLNDNQAGHLMIDDFCVTPLGGGSSNDATTQVEEPSSAQIATAIITSDNTDCTSPFDVFKFNISDDGATDGNPTIITNIRLKPAASNTASWVNNIKNVKVDNGSGYLVTNDAIITDNYLDISITATDFNIADAHAGTATIAICLNESGLTDGGILSFKVDATSHGFAADVSGSQFANTFAADVVSNDFTISVVCTTPTIEASNIAFSNISETGVTLNWDNGNGANRVVLAKLGSAVDANLVDNTTYTANSEFGLGDEPRTGNFIVFNGSSNTVNVTGLTENSTYHFKVIEYNCTGGDELYSAGTVANVSTTGTSINDLEANFIIYPNPATGTLFIENSLVNKGQISIKSITGQILLNKEINSNKTEIDLSNFAKGIYFINVNTKNNTFNSKIIIK